MSACKRRQRAEVIKIGNQLELGFRQEAAAQVKARATQLVLDSWDPQTKSSKVQSVTAFISIWTESYFSCIEWIKLLGSILVWPKLTLWDVAEGYRSAPFFVFLCRLFAVVVFVFPLFLLGLALSIAVYPFTFICCRVPGNHPKSLGPRRARFLVKLRIKRVGEDDFHCYNILSQHFRPRLRDFLAAPLEIDASRNYDSEFHPVARMDPGCWSCLYPDWKEVHEIAQEIANAFERPEECFECLRPEEKSAESAVEIAVVETEKLPESAAAKEAKDLETIRLLMGPPTV